MALEPDSGVQNASSEDGVSAQASLVDRSEDQKINETQQIAASKKIAEDHTSEASVPSPTLSGKKKKSPWATIGSKVWNTASALAARVAPSSMVKQKPGPSLDMELVPRTATSSMSIVPNVSSPRDGPSLDMDLSLREDLMPMSGQRMQSNAVTTPEGPTWVYLGCFKHQTRKAYQHAEKRYVDRWEDCKGLAEQAKSAWFALENVVRFHKSLQCAYTKSSKWLEMGGVDDACWPPQYYGRELCGDGHVDPCTSNGHGRAIGKFQHMAVYAQAEKEYQAIRGGVGARKIAELTQGEHGTLLGKPPN